MTIKTRQKRSIIFGMLRENQWVSMKNQIFQKFESLREIEKKKQFRILTNGRFCKTGEKLCFVIINKKINLSKTRKV